MKRAFAIIFSICAVGAQAQQQAGQPEQEPAKQSVIADKVVAVVGGSPILYSDVAKQAKALTEQYRSQNYTSPRPALAEALETLMEQKLLYQRAQIDSIGLENLAPRIAQAVEGNTEKMVAEAGSIKALETREHKPLYSIKEEMRKEYEEYLGAQEMRQWVTAADKVKVTPGEVDRFYRTFDRDSLPIIPEQYVYAQITKLPRTAEAAKLRAKERLLELRQRIIDGERFDRLAMMYSVDPGSAMRGGEMEAQPKESFVGPFADALTKLQPGQVSGVVETEFGAHIIQLIDKPAENLYHVRHILLKPSYTDAELGATLTSLDSLAGVIKAGTQTFAEAAIKNSDDKATRMNGGIVSNQQALYRYTGDSSPRSTKTRFVKDELDQEDAKQLIRLKEGEISRAFIGYDMRMDQMGKLFKLEQVIPAHRANLAEDWLAIENMALARKQNDTYRRWLNARIDEMYVRIDPMFHAADFENRRWFK